MSSSNLFQLRKNGIAFMLYKRAASRSTPRHFVPATFSSSSSSSSRINLTATDAGFHSSLKPSFSSCSNSSSSRFFSTGAQVSPPTSNHPYEALPGAKGSIIYTETDEAPALATFSFLPVLSKFGAIAGVDFIPCDISVAGRVLSTFPEYLKSGQQVANNLQYLGEICKTPEANIVKLPNISASIPQLKECIKELRDKGYDVPIYPEEPQTEEEIDIQKRYQTVTGSAVNPVLREGNSDRRVADPVKAYAQKNPHQMGLWSKASRTHVAHMNKGDFYSSEKSTTMMSDAEVVIEHIDSNSGTITVLKESTKLENGEVIDAATLDTEELKKFYELEIAEAKQNDLLFSLHLKATMMKISDPILFGHCVRVFFKSAFEKHEDVLAEIGANPNEGLGAVFESIKSKLSDDKAKEVMDDFNACYDDRPWLAMVNSDKGITNLHVPSDIIIDASMPVVVRDSGMMWNKFNELEDVKCVIPDRSYATMYQEMISYCKTRGQFDVSTMGNVSNVGLMAQKAEEYGSHDKTFEIEAKGTVRVRDATSNEIYFEHLVNKGDLWRMCQTKDAPIKDWVKLAVSRAKATGDRAIFWLDAQRPHDSNLIDKVNLNLKDHNTSGLDIAIMRPVDAMRISMERASAGLNTISVTGNVLRDYLTDLFPILELGTSAKMLSVVPLLRGGGLYETGAGGSAPKHVQQFVEQSHLRWDSLGEYLATAVAFEELGEKTGNDKATLLGKCLNKAVSRLLDNRKTPSRRVNEIDNRATNYYIALYWAEYLAEEDPDYKSVFDELSSSRSDIVAEFQKSQGESADLGGYYMFDYKKTKKAMNPSQTLNAILGL